MSRELYQKIGSSIRMHRKSADLTQEELAEMADISLRFLGAIEQGAAKPTLDVLEGIAKSLGLHVKELFISDQKEKGKPNLIFSEIERLIKPTTHEEQKMIKSFIKQLRLYSSNIKKSTKRKS